MGNQNTTQPDRGSQSTYEDRSVESRQHFPHHADDAARQPATPSHLQLSSHDEQQHQAQLHASRRIIAPFQNDPFRCDPTTAPVHRERSRPVPLPLPTLSVETTSPITACATNFVAPVHPVATRPSAPYAVHYNSSSETVLLLPPNYGRNPVQQAARSTVVAERASTTTTVTAAAAGGKGPSGTLPDGPVNDNEEDRIAKSTFYRNSSFTRRTVPQFIPVLEQLPMPLFDGDIREYNQFRDSFLTLIESQPNLPPLQKLRHLVTLLRGTPRSRAEGYGESDAAYWDVLEMLESSYGDQQIIRNTLRNDFVNLPLPEDRRADLTQFLEEVVTVARRLKRVGLDVDKESSFCALLMGHLPVPLRLKLIQSYGCRGAEKVSCILDGLRQYLNDIEEAEKHALTLRSSCKPVQAHSVPGRLPPRPEDPSTPHTFCEPEHSGMPHTSCEKGQQDPSFEDNEGIPSPSVETAASTVNKSSDDRLKKQRTCPLCGLLNHLAADCFVYPTIKKRLRRVLKLKLCLLCLRGEGHQASECPRRTKSSCKICGHGQHHRILCEDADDTSRPKSLRSSQMRATTGRGGHPASSDQKRSSRKKSVVRGATSCVAAAPVRHSGTQRSSSTRKSTLYNRKKKTWNRGADSQGRAGTARPTTSSTDERMKHKTAKAHDNARLLPARTGQLQTEPFSTNHESAADQQGPREAEEDSSPESSDSTPLPQTQATQKWTARPAPDPKLLPLWQPHPSDDDVSMPPSAGHRSEAVSIGREERCYAESNSYVACASTTEPTTLLECIVIPWSRRQTWLRASCLSLPDVRPMCPLLA